MLFSSATDVVPRPSQARWDELARRLRRHQERRSEDGPCRSTALYRAAYRAAATRVTARRRIVRPGRGAGGGRP